MLPLFRPERSRLTYRNPSVLAQCHEALAMGEEGRHVVERNLEPHQLVGVHAHTQLSEAALPQPALGASTCASPSALIATPYANRDERQAIAGFAQMLSPNDSAAARMSALRNPQTFNGLSKSPCSEPATWPGR